MSKLPRIIYNLFLLLFLLTMALVVFGDPSRALSRGLAAVVFLFFYVFLAVADKAAVSLLAEKRRERTNQSNGSGQA